MDFWVAYEVNLFAVDLNDPTIGFLCGNSARHRLIERGKVILLDTRFDTATTVTFKVSNGFTGTDYLVRVRIGTTAGQAIEGEMVLRVIDTDLDKLNL